jgi:NAD(P)-dependent dehydrogenase (short-subunit alcohol dehydrogenase family)
MQRALVTGASRGIGRALAVELASRGYEVVATARRVDDLADLPYAARLPLDVTSDASVAAAATSAGPIDLLINNAALGVVAPVEDTPAEVARAVFDTNVVGPLRLISVLLPGMRQRGGGTVVSVSSVAGQAVFPLTGVHAASKHALEALSEALAMEAGPLGIRVLIVELGSVAAGTYERHEHYVSPPYAYLDRERRRSAEGAPPNQISPEQAASAIADAIDATDTPLRLPIGPDAASLLAERGRLNDAGWAARAREFTYSISNCPRHEAEVQQGCASASA